MLENIIEDRDFAHLMKKNMEELIILFFQKEQNFGILCKIEDVSFNPELPEDINTEFRPLTLFFLAGYTFETARIEDGFLIFEAGFGSENFGSVVSVPLLSILQVIVDETPLFINLSVYKEDKERTQKEHKVDDKGVKNSMASFLSHPENSKFLKKK
ncbi:hypothetical protein [Sulfurimonas sp.]